MPLPRSEWWSCPLQLSGYSAALALDFLITLAVFPGISSAICSVQDATASFPCSATTPSGRFYGESSLDRLTQSEQTQGLSL